MSLKEEGQDGTDGTQKCVTIIGLIGTLLLYFTKGLLLIQWKGAKTAGWTIHLEDGVSVPLCGRRC